jgi:hypothetical protein
MQRLTAQTIMENGELLGYCQEKGFVYSVLRASAAPSNKKAYREYSVVAVQGNRVQYLIDHKVYV